MIKLLRCDGIANVSSGNLAILLAVWLGTAGILLPNTASAAAGDDDLQRGRVLVESNCSRCHAVGSGGSSPLAAAPLFRVLGERYPISDLEEALAEGILSGHPAMPEFSFEPDDIAAIVAYIQSLQKK